MLESTPLTNRPQLYLLESRRPGKKTESAARPAHATLEQSIDADVGPERRLLVLTVVEHPEVDSRIERMIASLGEELR
jgi:hypothetical protein